MSQNIPVVEKILSANDLLAQENRTHLDSFGAFSINIMASPGAGKTSLIERTTRALQGKVHIGMAILPPAWMLTAAPRRVRRQCKSTLGGIVTWMQSC